MEKNWKLHCFVTAVVNLLITFYFTQFAVRIIGKSYGNESPYGTRSYNFINCTAKGGEGGGSQNDPLPRVF